MTMDLFVFRNKLSVEIAAPEQEMSTLVAVFLPAPEDPGVGEPGKQPGSIFLQIEEGRRTAVVSLGAGSKIKADNFRQAGGGLARWLQHNKAGQISINLQKFDPLGMGDALEALLEGLFLGAFAFDRYKEKSGEQPDIMVLIHNPQNRAELQQVLQRARTVTTAVNLARDWAHEPANVINPTSLAERAQWLAEQNNLKFTVLDAQQLEQMGAGGIISVGKGSATPSRMIIIEYPGQGDAVGTQPVILVGKAITFDTGGYSLKPVQGIVGMKGDKAGGMDVAGIMQAAAQLNLKTPVVGIICAAENMISGEAYRPDDIIHMLNGKTVEIISTDAEGRLVLADGLAYAQQHYQPRAIIDLATLTGGVVTALGRVRAGVMTNNNELFQQLAEAGEQSHERLWQLPLDEEYFQFIKGDEADIKNSGGREAHPIMGGIFLKQFVSDEIPWAHIDIAGVSETDKDLPYVPKGASGFGVRLLVDYLRNLEA